MEQNDPTPKHGLPLVIIKTGSMKRRDIDRAEKRGFICIVESDAPESIRVLDTPLQMASLDAQAQASIRLMRLVVEKAQFANSWSLDARELVQFFVKCLLGPYDPPQVPPVVKVKQQK